MTTMTKRMSAQAPASRVSGSAASRVVAREVIALPPCMDHPGSVKSWIKRTKALTPGPRRFSVGCSMARATSFIKPISIFAFVARFHLS
jgi:hypothetical protein